MTDILLILYTTATVVSAALLFLVQPMIGKMLLPRLGGTPAVWNTCMVFFQAVLLAGYAYAHLITRRLRARQQILLHVAVLVLPLLVLPLHLAGGEAPAGGDSPVLWLLGALLATIGLPFFALSTTGPLLQRWFASSEHRESKDPYFLYAAGNVGSLGALLAYPWLLEPRFPLAASPLSQVRLWSAAYLAFALLTTFCGVLMLRRRVPEAHAPASHRSRGAKPAAAGVTASRRVLWVLLAFVPSSAMLGATQYITTDLAAIPLLWVLPLTVYLLTFILSFSRRRWIAARWSSAALAVLVVGVALSFWIPVPWLLLILSLHLLTLLAVGLVCHGRLASDRPPPERLTEFYLLIGTGGLLGGIFNALLAPLLFRSVVEYPFALLLACLLRPGPWGRSGSRESASARWLDLAFPAGVALVAVAMSLFVGGTSPSTPLALVFLGAAVPAALVLLSISRPLRFALGLLVLLVAGWAQARSSGPVLLVERTFFGVNKVVRFESKSSELPPFHSLYNGTTKHGLQIVDERLRLWPTLYFHPAGPIGHVFRSLQDVPNLRVAVIGLGAGTLAAYGRPGQRFTFYEIDPAVVEIARDPRYFTYLSDCRADSEIIVGDGRLQLARAPDGGYGLIIMDAFSSDAVPVHLITREAVEMYFRKLSPDGLLVVNLTNSYMNLVPVLDAIASALDVSGLVWRDRAVTRDQFLQAKTPSTWAVLGRDRSSLAALAFPKESRRLPRVPGVPPEAEFLWTDDYSNLFALLRASPRAGRLP